ncbi:MAG: hypothetical protein JXB38_19670 [Anaerolineales bacterium]|nr:hypothetical protein [Anaerolineales bacterium]
MYKFRGFFFHRIASFFLIALLIIGGMAIFRAGMMRGVLMGTLLSGGEGLTLPETYALHPYVHGWGSPVAFGMPLFGLILGGFLLLFLIGGIVRFFQYRSMRKWMEEHPEWAEAWHGRRGPGGPWGMHRHWSWGWEPSETPPQAAAEGEETAEA